MKRIISVNSFLFLLMQCIIYASVLPFGQSGYGYFEARSYAHSCNYNQRPLQSFHHQIDWAAEIKKLHSPQDKEHEAWMRYKCSTYYTEAAPTSEPCNNKGKTNPPPPAPQKPLAPNTIADKKQAIPTNPLGDLPPPSDPGDKNQRRARQAEAQNHMDQHGAIITTRWSTLSPSATEALQHYNFDPQEFTRCNGNQLQQVVHKDCVAVINSFAARMTTTEVGALPPHSAMQLFFQGTDLGRRLNKNGRWNEAIVIIDACWEYHNQLWKAAGEGVYLGAENTLNSVLHPLDAARSFGTFLYTVLAITTSMVKEVIMSSVDKERRLRNIIKVREKVQSAKTHIAHMRGPDLLRAGVTIAVETLLTGKIWSGANKLWVVTKNAQQVQNLYAQTGVRIARCKKIIKDAFLVEEIIGTTPEGIKIAHKNIMGTLHALKEKFQGNSSQNPKPQPPPRGGGGITCLNPNSPHNKVIKTIAIEPNTRGIIQEFNITQKIEDHVFSSKHKERGVLKLGNSQEHILISIAEVIKNVDYEGLLHLGDNHIETMINNHLATIRVRIEAGSVLSFNAFAEAAAPHKNANFIKYK